MRGKITAIARRQFVLQKLFSSLQCVYCRFITAECGMTLPLSSVVCLCSFDARMLGDDGARLGCFLGSLLAEVNCSPAHLCFNNFFISLFLTDHNTATRFRSGNYALNPS